jgi:hypothetical protein
MVKTISGKGKQWRGGEEAEGRGESTARTMNMRLYKNTRSLGNIKLPLYRELLLPAVHCLLILSFPV